MNRLTSKIGVLVWAVMTIPLASRGESDQLFEIFDTIEQAARFESKNGFFQVQGGGWADWEIYTIDQRAAGLLHPDADDDILYRPRLTITTDTFIGKHLYSFAKARWDTGFDAGYETNALRMDEYFLRGSFFESAFNIQVGKMGTVFGNWVGRHGSWENPFVTSPLPYETVTSISDFNAFSGVNALAANAGRWNNLKRWIPMIWGPSYTTGASVFGSVEKFNYAFEAKSAGLSSRLDRWEEWNFNDIAYAGRIGYHPNAMWDFGFSAAVGSYLRSEADITLPPGSSFDDFDQTTFGFDIKYAHRHLQIWGEFIYSEFELPNIASDARTGAYYIEARYKWNESLFTALRWNHQLFNSLELPGGGSVNWDNDTVRIDTSIVYRLNRNFQAKLQYSWTHHDANFQNGENLVAGQVTIRF